MRYQSTVFGQLLKALPRGWFARTAARHDAGRAKRALSPWGHVATMVLAQASGARSLREVERLVAHHPGVLAHLGLARVRRATLADANAKRPAALFEAVAAKLAGAGRHGRAALRLIDATHLVAGRRIESWSAGGIKLHVVFDPEAQRPVCFAVTPGRVHDIAAAKALPIEAGATYVFDKGYYDFAFWAKLAAAGCRFVTRLKINSPARLVVERPSDRLSGQRRNPYDAPVRLVGVRIATGRELVLVTNDLDAPAETIAELYKARWQIELFFKWIKQNLKLGHFLGTSRNAVVIHIMAALIAFLLLKRASERCQAEIALQAAARLLPATLLARRRIAELFKPPKPPPPPPQNPQLIFAYA